MNHAITDGRVISPLATDANWDAIRAYRERHCVSCMTPEHWAVVSLCDRALRDFSDHDAWSRLVAEIAR